MAGLDLGDKHSFVCLIDLDGKIVERKKLRTSPTAFERYFGGWAGPLTSLAFVLNLDNNPRQLRRSRDAGARMGCGPSDAIRANDLRS